MQNLNEASSSQIDFFYIIKELISAPKKATAKFRLLKDILNYYNFNINDTDLNEIYQDIHSNKLNGNKQSQIELFKKLSIILDGEKKWQPEIERKYDQSDELFKELKILARTLFFYPRFLLESLQETFKKNNIYINPDIISELQIEISNISLKGDYSIFCKDVYKKLSEIIDRDKKRESTIDKTPMELMLENLKQWSYAQSCSRNGSFKLLIYIFKKYGFFLENYIPRQELKDIFNAKKEFFRKRNINDKIFFNEIYAKLCDIVDRKNSQLQQEEHNQFLPQEELAKLLIQKFYTKTTKFQLIDFWTNLSNNQRILFTKYARLSYNLKILDAIANDDKLVTELWGALQESHSTIAKIRKPQQILSILQILEKTNLDLYINFWFLLPEEMQKQQEVLLRDMQFKHYSRVIGGQPTNESINILDHARKEFQKNLYKWAFSNNDILNTKNPLLNQDSLIIIFSKYLKAYNITLDVTLKQTLDDIVNKRRKVNRWSKKLKQECFIELLNLANNAIQTIHPEPQQEEQKISLYEGLRQTAKKDPEESILGLQEMEKITFRV